MGDWWDGTEQTRRRPNGVLCVPDLFPFKKRIPVDPIHYEMERLGIFGFTEFHDHSLLNHSRERESTNRWLINICSGAQSEEDISTISDNWPNTHSSLTNWTWRRFGQSLPILTGHVYCEQKGNLSWEVGKKTWYFVTIYFSKGIRIISK